MYVPLYFPSRSNHCRGISRREQSSSQNYLATNVSLAYESFARPSNYHAIAIVDRFGSKWLSVSISTDQRNNEERLLRRLPIPSWRITISYRVCTFQDARLSQRTRNRESSRVGGRRGEARRSIVSRVVHLSVVK